MALSFRKSFGNSLFRVNISKSGLSYSTGIKGARINTGPRGTYVTFSAYGLQYRKKIAPSTVSPNPSPQVQLPPIYNGVHTITSADIDNLTDTDSKDFIRELTEKAQKYSLQFWFATAPFLIGLGLLFFNSFSTKTSPVSPAVDKSIVTVTSYVGANIRSEPTAKSEVVKAAKVDEVFTLLDSSNGKWLKIQMHDTIGYINKQLAVTGQIHNDRIDETETSISNDYFWIQAALLFIGFIILYIWTGRLDKKRFEMEIYYEMDENIKGVYDKFITHFTELIGSSRTWQYLHASNTSDYKRTGGASQLIRRIPIGGISANRKPIKFFTTNVSIPYIRLRNTELYFLPERLLIKRGNQFAAVFYQHLTISGNITRFIEDESVPHDAVVVGQTWKFLNKKGGPDRRFNNNRQIPICHYSEYTIKSETGVYEIITTSKIGAFDNFSRFLAQIGQLQARIQLK